MKYISIKTDRTFSQKFPVLPDKNARRLILKKRVHKKIEICKDIHITLFKILQFKKGVQRKQLTFADSVSANPKYILKFINSKRFTFSAIQDKMYLL